jgi:hypothetical protein
MSQSLQYDCINNFSGLGPWEFVYIMSYYSDHYRKIYMRRDRSGVKISLAESNRKEISHTNLIYFVPKIRIFVCKL